MQNKTERDELGKKVQEIIDRETAKRTPEEMNRLMNAMMLRKMWEQDMARLDKINERIINEPGMSNRTLIRLGNEALKLEARWANKDHGF